MKEGRKEGRTVVKLSNEHHDDDDHGEGDGQQLCLLVVDPFLTKGKTKRNDSNSPPNF
jgi:hypothetical protein